MVYSREPGPGWTYVPFRARSQTLVETFCERCLTMLGLIVKCNSAAAKAWPQERTCNKGFKDEIDPG